MRRVLMFAHECAPYQRQRSTIGAQRPAQFAKHLPAYGWQAVVLCCDAARKRLARRADRAAIEAQVQRCLAEAGPQASVVIPTPSLPWDGWIDRSWLHLRGRPGALSRLLRRLLTAVKMARGDYSQSWQPVARWAAEAVAEHGPIHACMAAHSPDAGLFLSGWFSRRYGVPWIADFRDPILAPFQGLARRVYLRIARRLVAGAACTLNVNPYWAELDQRLLGRPARCVPNGFDPTEFEGPAPALSERLTIAYTGSIKPTQEIELFFDALRRLAYSQPELERRLRFVYRGVTVGLVRALAREYRLQPLVDAGPHLDRREALNVLRAADVLLLLSVSPRPPGDLFLARGVFPAKTFEYFGAARPILCVPGDAGLLERLIEDTKTGTIAGTPEQIAWHLSAALELRRAGRPLPYQPDPQQVARYSRRRLTGALARILDSLTEGRPIPTDAELARS